MKIDFLYCFYYIFFHMFLVPALDRDSKTIDIFDGYGIDRIIKISNSKNQKSYNDQPKNDNGKSRFEAQNKSWDEKSYETTDSECDIIACKYFTVFTGIRIGENISIGGDIIYFFGQPITYGGYDHANPVDHVIEEPIGSTMKWFWCYRPTQLMQECNKMKDKTKKYSYRHELRYGSNNKHFFGWDIPLYDS